MVLIKRLQLRLVSCMSCMKFIRFCRRLLSVLLESRAFPASFDILILGIFLSKNFAGN